MKPESMIVGRNDDSSAIWKATCWLSAIAEMSRPIPSAPERNSAEREQQQRDRSANGQIEQHHRRDDHGDGRDERDHEIRQALADDEGQRADRRHAHLLDGAALLLAHNRQRRRDDRGDHRDVGEKAWHQEQRALEVRVVPDPRLELDHRACRPASAPASASRTAPIRWR